MPVKVFISHKNEDSIQAGAVAAYLRSSGLDVYLDVIDRQLDKSGPDLADYMRDELGKCTQLLAVLSTRTQASWWVPWEIGVATEKERFLASYISDNVKIPDFLVKWPYLRNNVDLDIYIRESKKAQSLVEERVKSGHTATARGAGFRSFHSSLKASLGQP